ncbi:adaptor protein [Salipaludibacillus neizhouensis]|uniref:Adaptor protein n=1 Tax=Salipaludibacillus neizhouensis TaxID=885475 RepID=A0A3A9K5U1_9BACI|nr:adaptor protein MecA [Salipaludibacillus neizhouensis]RKL67619.1 adaptor protein [Salipaludibacillus neizhouensis]
MRLERLAYDKMKIFLTYDDLDQRGISTENTWFDTPVIDEVFRDMITEASVKLDFDPDGPIVVEVYSVPSQGIVIIVTKTEELVEDHDEISMDWDISSAVSSTDPFIYRFESLDDVIHLAVELSRINVQEGQLYSYENNYYLLFPTEIYSTDEMLYYEPLIQEYGNRTTHTKALLEAYGNPIIVKNAVKNLIKYFC